MKTYIFNNGEKRFESQIGKGVDFKTTCIFWGCFDKETLEPLPYTTHETTEKELKEEEIRVLEIKQGFSEICEKNNIIAKGNEKIANATNNNEFINAYL